MRGTGVPTAGVPQQHGPPRRRVAIIRPNARAPRSRAERQAHTGRSTMVELPRIAFLGAGQMAEAVLRGLLRAEAAPPHRLYASDIRRDRLDYITTELGIQSCDNNREALRQSEVAVIAVKPQDAPELLTDMQHAVHADHLI